MADDRDVLASLAGAVADGLPIDWATAGSMATSQAARSLVDELRLLDELHRIHRSTSASFSEPAGDQPITVASPSPSKPSAPAPRTGDETTATTGEPARWGSLEIRGVLGIGGFGIVYRAWDPNLATEVALKVLTHDVSVGAVEEGRLLARVRHPNIVSIYGADRCNGQVGLWMELVRGKTLKQVLKEHGAFGAREAALVGIDLTRALAAVHGAGLVHRDVKPHNVMREDGGRLVLMDFGAGVESAELSEGPQRRYAGTPLYTAPELFDARPPTPQSDLYSLGVLLYHLVTGAYPLEGDSPTQMQAAHQKGERKRLRDVRPDLPAEFVRIVERAMEPDAARRYQSAGELEADLAQFVVLADGRIGRPRPGRPRTRRGIVVAAAIAAVLVIAAVLAVPRFRPTRSGAVVPRFRSVVVLPLLNLSGDPAQEFFADGMTDLLIADLSMLGNLRVISRTSAMAFKSTHRPLPEIAHALNVEGVIEGSVIRSGNHVRVTVELIEAGTDFHLWTQQYEGDVTDVLGFDRAIVQRIAREIGTVVSPPLQQRFTSTRPVKADAQDEYLRGRYKAITESGYGEALEHFQKAVRLDPDYALAYVGLANVYRSLANRANPPQREEYYQRGREAALRALNLDNGLAGAHLALANIDLYANWNWKGAATGFEHALALNPNDPDAHQGYAWYLAARGDTARALEHAQTARELDPLALIRRTTRAGILYYARRYPEAVAELRDVLGFDRNFVVAHVGLARTYAAMHEYDAAAAEIHQMMQVGGSDANALSELGRIYAEQGRLADGRKVLKEIEALVREGKHVGVENFAGLYGALGDRDEAIARLHEGLQQHAAGLLWMKVDPRFDPIRQDSRFQALLRDAGLE